jgi:acid phosphatase type 7
MFVPTSADALVSRNRSILCILAFMSVSLCLIASCGGGSGKKEDVVARFTGKVPITEYIPGDEPVTVTRWLVAGAFPSKPVIGAAKDEPTREGHTTDYLASLGGEVTARPEQGLEVSRPGGGILEFRYFEWEGPYLDITKLDFGREVYVSMYLYAEIESDREQTTYLHVGTNDCGKYWLNGKLVIEEPIDGVAKPSEQIALVTLNAGRNRMLIKIGQAGGGWGSYVQLYDRDAHVSYVKENFPTTFDVRIDSSVFAVGDTARFSIFNWPDWPDSLVSVTWKVRERGGDWQQAGTGPTLGLPIDAGKPRVLHVTATAKHPASGEQIFGDADIFAGGNADTDFFQPTSRPDHLVMSLGQKAETDRGFSWRTDTNTKATAVQIIQTATTSPEAINWRSSLVKTTRSRSSVCQSHRGTFRAHEATLTGLKTGERYVYRVGSGTNWSRAHAFRVGNPQADSVRIAVIGDTRDNVTWGTLIQQIAEHRPAFIIHAGKIVADGRNVDEWNRWFYRARHVLPSIPFMPVTSSLERRYPLFLKSFTLPRNAPEEGLRELCYSVDYGPIHLVAMDSEYRLKAQADWLDKDLASTSKPWKLAVWNRPPYRVDEIRSGSNWEVEEVLCPVLDKHLVALSLHGGDPYYLRTKPIRAGKVSAEGVVYVNTGGSGSTTKKTRETDLVAAAENEPHFVIVTAGKTTIKTEARTIYDKILDKTVVAR